MLITMNEVILIITFLCEFCFYLLHEIIFTEELYSNKLLSHLFLMTYLQNGSH